MCRTAKYNIAEARTGKVSPERERESCTVCVPCTQVLEVGITRGKEWSTTTEMTPTMSMMRCSETISVSFTTP